MSKRLYVLYDGRARKGGNTDDAVVLDTCDTYNEAFSVAPDYGQCSCWSYAVDELYPGGNTVLKDERWEFDYWPEDAA